MNIPAPSKVWLITGCSSGFGRAIAEAALEAGQRVIATARDVRRISDLEHEGRCITLPLDITEADSISPTVQEAAKQWGTLDVIVNNAGYGLIGAVEECDDAQTRRNFETNFFGPLNVIRAALPVLRAQRGGYIVNISAAAAISNYAGFGIYGGAKAALELMSESLRAELAPHGIKITLVQPGPFRTDFIARGLEKATGQIEDYTGSAHKFARFLDGMSGKQPGDPVKAAAAIVKVVLSGEAPLHLPLGKYVIKKLRDKAAALTREAEHWESVASDTEFTT
jgi:NAD(P)-dependent dehydrogenase (short-subunit alcohol dehydrogenase family)